MKMPPEHRRIERVIYRMALFFFPDPFRDCVSPNHDRVADYHRRLGRHKATITGRPHEQLLGEYNAREYVRRANVSRVWDEMSNRIARVHRKPNLPR